jgi:hypothetical protein
MFLSDRAAGRTCSDRGRGVRPNNLAQTFNSSVPNVLSFLRDESQ